MPHPSRILTKNPGDNHLKHYGLETNAPTMTKKTQERLVEKEEEKKREKMTHIYTFLKISFLSGGIDTKIFEDRIFGGLFFFFFFFGAKKATRKTSLLANRFTVKGHFSSPFHFILSTSQMRSGRGRCPAIICIFILLFSSSCMTHPGTQAFNGGISGREGHSVLGGTGW